MPDALRRILVVEDHDDSRSVLVMLLQVWGYEVDDAATGREAFEKARTGWPDIVLLDLNLPDWSGYDVARALRTLPGGRPFVIAVSGYDSIADRVRAAEVGCDVFLLKPGIDELERLLADPTVGRQRTG